MANRLGEFPVNAVSLETRGLECVELEPWNLAQQDLAAQKHKEILVNDGV